MDRQAIWFVLESVPDPEIPVVSVVDLVHLDHAYTRSTMIAMPWPTPMHMVHSA